MATSLDQHNVSAATIQRVVAANVRTHFQLAALSDAMLEQCMAPGMFGDVAGLRAARDAARDASPVGA